MDIEEKNKEFERRIREFELTQDIPIDDPREYIAEMRKIFQLMSDILEFKISQQENGK